MIAWLVAPLEIETLIVSSLTSVRFQPVFPIHTALRLCFLNFLFLLLWSPECPLLLFPPSCRPLVLWNNHFFSFPHPIFLLTRITLSFKCLLNRSVPTSYFPSSKRCHLFRGSIHPFRSLPLFFASVTGLLSFNEVTHLPWNTPTRHPSDLHRK